MLLDYANNTDEQLVGVVRDALRHVFGAMAELESIDIHTDLSSLGLDSVAALEVAAYLEDELDLRLMEAELTAATTVRGLVGALREALAGGAESTTRAAR
jgi:acyl carrier protein